MWHTPAESNQIRTRTRTASNEFHQLLDGSGGRQSPTDENPYYKQDAVGVRFTARNYLWSAASWAMRSNLKMKELFEIAAIP